MAVELTKGRVTHGHVAGSRVRLVIKPTTGQQYVRRAGVIRRSDKVRRVNKVVADAKPAKDCKGKPYDEFRRCLRERMKALLSKAV
jgi:hypothetical protein